MRVMFAVVLFGMMLGAFVGLLLGSIFYLSVGPDWAGALCLVGLIAWVVGCTRIDFKQLGP